MQKNMWIYPWDILDIGIETIAGELFDEVGINGLSIATAYHAGHFLQPRSPKRKIYFPEDGTIYFEPDMSLYKDSLMKPKVSSIIEQGTDVFRQAESYKKKYSFALNGWTVCLHNTRLGMEHPDACTRNAFGDVNYYNLCPSNSMNTAYLSALVKDITTHYKMDSLELESPNFMGFAHEFHHEKDGVGLNDYGDFLLSLCFCPECTHKATEAGVDVEKARASVRRRLDEIFDRAIPKNDPGFIEKGIDNFADDPELKAFLAWRFTPVTDLCAALKRSANPSTAIYFLSLVTKRTWLQGIDVAEIAKVCDGLVVCAYDSSPEQVYLDIKEAAGLIRPKYLSAGFRVFYPEMHDAREITSAIRSAQQAGANALNFYNYGLLPKTRLSWIHQGIEGLFVDQKNSPR